MSIIITNRRVGEALLIVRQTICDACGKLLDECPGTESDHVGVTLPVCDWCKDCAPKHSIPMDGTHVVVRGACVGNTNGLTKVRITK